jgi:predicted acyltransferase
MANETSNRLISLDVFRGITIALMVLVNNPGTWNAIHSPLKHAEWHGSTPTDLVFPFFLFIVGIAITLALGKRVEQGGITAGVYWKIIRRSALIFLLGLFLAGFPFYDLSVLRIPGVLQRIAVCYLIASLLFLHTNWKSQTIITIGLLFGYWALMTLTPIPGYGISDIDSKEWNIAAYIDRLIFGANHIWRSAKVYDPEGILSTIPAVATTLTGVLTGHWLRTKNDDWSKVTWMAAIGLVLVVLGLIWDIWFPLNKPLWTSSYVLFTSGAALGFLSFCYWTIDILGFKMWAKPFVIFGVNALALYVLSGIMARILTLIKFVGTDGKEITLQKWIFDSYFLPLASPVNASLIYAVCYIFLWLFLMWILYRNKIFIKV